ncbi:MAG: hypothetical protein RMY62_024605 [Nostoc sp. ZfuVER08]|uniref:Uncharacterized protein n=1 Tax=Nostoc punctiforme FACHB-252 TaxID=1357509 RepID=A0ABR8HAJ8_NOSPU|nr:hypothetical protein [Nostoc punctiforme]MBD2612709.1 hypothetical protein [Nostoc punctiforme FACHB-252]MDZ8010862.1 hypothetical protein [Nostoc sp. ZfuVER08]
MPGIIAKQKESDFKLTNNIQNQVWFLLTGRSQFPYFEKVGRQGRWGDKGDGEMGGWGE